MPGAEAYKLAYAGTRDIACAKTSLNLKGAVNTVGLSASLVGSNLPTDLSKICASKTIDASGVTLTAEPSYLVRAKKAALKLVAKKNGASVTCNVPQGGTPTYNVRAFGAQVPKLGRRSSAAASPGPAAGGVQREPQRGPHARPDCQAAGEGVGHPVHRLSHRLLGSVDRKDEPEHRRPVRAAHCPTRTRVELLRQACRASFRR